MVRRDFPADPCIEQSPNFDRLLTDVSDAISEDLPDAEAARACAMQMASAFIGRPITHHVNGGALVVSVRDAGGASVLTVRLVLSVEAG